MVTHDPFYNPSFCGICHLLTPGEVASMLKIGVKTVHKLVREGKLACVQVTSRERRFTHQQVEDYVRSQTTFVRVDSNPRRTVSSGLQKGGTEKKSVGVTRRDLREEMKQWR